MIDFDDERKTVSFADGLCNLKEFTLERMK
jgi:hypothetical protein